MSLQNDNYDCVTCHVPSCYVRVLSREAGGFVHHKSTLRQIFLITMTSSYSSQFFFLKIRIWVNNIKKVCDGGFAILLRIWEVPCSNFGPDERLYLPHPFLSLYMTVHTIYLRPTAIISSHPQATYTFQAVSFKFSTVSNEHFSSSFSIYVTNPRQGLLVRKRVPSSSKLDRMQNPCRKSVSTSSIRVHFILFVQRKNKHFFLAADKWHAFLAACSSLRSAWLTDRRTDRQTDRQRICS